MKLHIIVFWKRLLRWRHHTNRLDRSTLTSVLSSMNLTVLQCDALLNAIGNDISVRRQRRWNSREWMPHPAELDVHVFYLYLIHNIFAEYSVYSYFL